MGCFPRSGREGSRVRCFSWKGEKQKKKRKVYNSHFLGLHTCDPAGPAVSPVSMCILVCLKACRSLCFVLPSLCDWWVVVRAGSLPQPRPDQACSGHNNAINMCLTAACECVCVKHKTERYHNPKKQDTLVEFPFPAPVMGLKACCLNMAPPLIARWITFISPFMNHLQHVTVWLMDSLLVVLLCSVLVSSCLLRFLLLQLWLTIK